MFSAGKNYGFRKSAMDKTITIDRLHYLMLTNSKDLPVRVKVKRQGKYIFFEWVGFAWIEIEEPFYPDEVIEVR